MRSSENQLHTWVDDGAPWCSPGFVCCIGTRYRPARLRVLFHRKGCCFMFRPGFTSIKGDPNERLRSKKEDGIGFRQVLNPGLEKTFGKPS
jgi:hypothetical protein